MLNIFYKNGGKMEGRGIGVTVFSRYKMEGRYRRSIALSLPSIFSDTETNNDGCFGGVQLFVDVTIY